MSEQELVIDEQDQERPERGVLHRTFDVELTPGDGRTVDVRIVPYGTPALADDGYGGVPQGIPYTEEFMPGVFAHQTNAANRVLVNFEHQKGIAGVVGHGLMLREAKDGFYGSFRLHNNADGDKTLMLVNEGVLGGVSLEAVPMKNGRSTTGVVQRVKAHLRAIALCRGPAYPGAAILAVRTETIIDEDLVPVPLDPEIVERCRKLGIRLPQRYEAHPDETDTPAETAGTSEDGTRPETENTTSLEE